MEIVKSRVLKNQLLARRFERGVENSDRPLLCAKHVVIDKIVIAYQSAIYNTQYSRVGGEESGWRV